MTKDNPLNLLDLLDELIHLPPEQRLKQLSSLQLPADDRSKLESWLGHAGEAAGFLAKPPGAVADAEALLNLNSASMSPNEQEPLRRTAELVTANPLPPEIVGYEVNGLLGQGGMATVWRAIQKSTGREVALKVMDPLLLASRRARARFERELNLSARLTHPNIARVYDGGATGLLGYYAMELIEGSPLDLYVEKHHLSVKQILSLMLNVCDAVWHAHLNGVIHRDLKPSNILVDSVGQPHVLDFGLARALEDVDPDFTVTTDGALAGTIAFMSPEQAIGSAAVDARTDVYSLSVILYRLLTGASPYDLSGSRAKVLKTIIEQIPVRPSQIRRTLDRELDWITLKALEKDPSRRYNDAHGMSQDIQRYLRGHPVDASPPSIHYRTRKFVRRHWLGLSVALGFAALLIGATAVSAVLAVRATRAQRAETKERKNAELIAGTLESVFSGLNKVVDTKPEDFKARFSADLDDASSSLDSRLNENPAVRARLRNSLGISELALGNPEKAIRLFRRSLDDIKVASSQQTIQPIDVEENLGRAYNAAGDPRQAITILERVRDQRARRSEAHTDQMCRTLTELVNAYDATNRRAEGISLCEQIRTIQIRNHGSESDEAITSMSRLAHLYEAANRNKEAMAIRQDVFAQRLRLFGGDNPETLNAMADLAGSYRSNNRLTEAIDLYEKAYARQCTLLGADNLTTLRTQADLGWTYRDAGDEIRAKKVLEAARDLQAKRATAVDTQSWPRQSYLAATFLTTGRTAEAASLFEQIRSEQQRTLGPESPSTLITEKNLALAYSQSGRVKEAIDLFKHVEAKQARVLGINHPDTLNTCANLAAILSQFGYTSEAIAIRQQLLTVSRSDSGKQDPNTLGLERKLANDYYNSDRFADAEPLYREVVESLYSDAVWTAAERDTFDKVIDRLISCCQRLNRPSQVDKWEGLLRQHLTQDIDNATHRIDQLGANSKASINAIGTEALLQERLGQYAASELNVKQVLKLDPSVHRAWYDLVCIQCYLGQEQNYRATCEELLTRFGNTNDVGTADRTLKACLLAKPSADEQVLLSRLQKLVSSAKADQLAPYFHLSTGMYEFRCGNLQNAIDLLTKSRDEFANIVSQQNRAARDGLNNDEALATAGFYLALAQFQNGDKDEALKTFDNTGKHFNERVAKASSMTSILAGADWFICQCANREAEAVFAPAKNFPTTRR